MCVRKKGGRRRTRPKCNPSTLPRSRQPYYVCPVCSAPARVGGCRVGREERPSWPSERQKHGVHFCLGACVCVCVPLRWAGKDTRRETHGAPPSVCCVCRAWGVMGGAWAGPSSHPFWHSPRQAQVEEAAGPRIYSPEHYGRWRDRRRPRPPSGCALTGTGACRSGRGAVAEGPLLQRGPWRDQPKCATALASSTSAPPHFLETKPKKGADTHPAPPPATHAHTARGSRTHTALSPSPNPAARARPSPFARRRGREATTTPRRGPAFQCGPSRSVAWSRCVGVCEGERAHICH